MKGILLYLLPAPILLTAVLSFLRGDVSAIVTNSIAFALFLLAASLAKRGFIQEQHYHDSTFIKAPKLPYKTVAALFLSIATYYSAYFCTENSALLSTLLALASFFGFYLYYGFDPRIDKIGELPLGVNAQDLIETIQNAKEKVAKLQLLKRELKDFESKEYLQSIIWETEEIITSVEKNPSDLSRARKFFKIYLARTEKITTAFIANLKNENIDTEITANYNRLLKSMQGTIKEQKDKLNDDDILRLDIEIEALTKQLQHEGV